MSLSTLRVVDTYEESEELMRSSQKPVIRLQTGLNAHRNTNLTKESLRNLIRNMRIFYSVAQKCDDDFLFLHVTGGTLCYWSFYYDGSVEHCNNFHGMDGRLQISASEVSVRRQVDALATKSSASELQTLLGLFDSALNIEN